MLSPKSALSITNHSHGSKDSILKFMKISEHAFAPVKGSVNAAGFDLFSAYNYIVPAHKTVCVKTDIKLELPEGCYGRIAPRSGLALYKNINIGGGVIDQDYRGNICIIIFNLADVHFNIERGDKIAQLICEKIEMPILQECNFLLDTERGCDGFGSTGKK